MGNTGPSPEIFIAALVNGYVFECFDKDWYASFLPQPSEAGWRRTLDEYRMMQRDTRQPRINILEGCGRETTLGFGKTDRNYLEPTATDLVHHRLALGTALLDDGFYEYDLFDAGGAPFWFDEFTVDENGIAVENRRFKGYLGQPLGAAVELPSPATLIWDENFETGTLPTELSADPGVSVSQAPHDVITGAGSLVINNPDHSRRAFIAARTKPSQITFPPGQTYVIEHDWKILETIDNIAVSQLRASDGSTPGWYPWPGVVAGDSGQARFHVTVPDGGAFTLEFQLTRGGGKIAVDNVRVTAGGAGPWRRDFENGFVLVNPINRSYTFNPEELAGQFNRTGIKRIKGTQAPDFNNGQPVTGTLTLKPFNAIILLANHIPT